MKGFPLEFGIGVRDPKCLNDGATRWSKKFSDRFSRFDTITAVTDSQPPSQPARQTDRHVAVANTRYAYRCIAPKTRSSADADNGLDAFVGQSRSTNILGPFQVK